ncbi:putative membrane protein [Crossiella equi]|uniref:Membrane protein n=1 Tax=Crossiella equi TaxID=130796 RepID=A0ABS5AJ26_9PSEU|nr:MauE/DoxX family redox-associated membrane protein [Crossiella equi]MBP2476570.1 putative membrane protein [Crossiella equi]
MKLSKAAGLAGLLLTAGAAHFARPKPFDEIVPASLPGDARTWTYVSGVAELAVGAAVAVPKTRKLGALAAAALFVAVFPANVKMAWDWRDKPLKQRLIAFGRLPLQVPLVLWALKVRRDAE